MIYLRARKEWVAKKGISKVLVHFAKQTMQQKRTQKRTQTQKKPPANQGRGLLIYWFYLFNFGRSGQIWTDDPYTPSIVRYQAALRSGLLDYSRSLGGMQSAFL